MCGRYYIAEEDAEEMENIVREVGRKYAGQTVATGEIFPTNRVPVVATNRRRETVPFLMKWGFTAGKRPVINARSETAASLPLFRSSFAERRCLIPATRYFEWEKRDGERVRYAIAPDAPMFYMAGLYRFEDGESLPTFAILTRAAADPVAFIHDRMPVIVPRDALEEWLAPGGDAAAVLREAVGEVTPRVG